MLTNFAGRENIRDTATNRMFSSLSDHLYTVPMTVPAILHTESIRLLRQLIAMPSFSREENGTADILAQFLQERGVACRRLGHNVWARNRYWTDGKPVVLLNSHHDTVRPAAGWTRDPFLPAMEDDRLYGLGSNDAGGCLVSLMAAFRHFYEKDGLPFNLLLAATAEEEISGPNGIAALLQELPPIAMGIVGEPTRLRMATAEKGLMVIDAVAHGRAGHAARDEGINALYLAMDDISRLRSFQFDKVSPRLGPIRLTVTQIEAGHQHNVVPDRCRFVIDVRTNECYSNQEVFAILQQELRSELQARSFRLNSSGIAGDHPLVRCGRTLGLETFGSPTLSDQALMPFPTIKLGPGDSARSHSADEYVRPSEVRSGIQTYVRMLEQLCSFSPAELQDAPAPA